MKKKFLTICILLFSFSIFCEQFEFDGGYYIIEKIDGVDDLDNVKIVYDDGVYFYGSASSDGYPLYGVMVDTVKGTTYTGGFDSNEQYSGKGILKSKQFIYEGEFSKGQKNGFGILTLLSKNIVYEGNFYADKRSGDGKEYSTISNYYYEGAWENDKFNGEGLLIDDAGNSYKGVFKDDKIQGLGEKITSRGNIAIGSWLNDKTVHGSDCRYIGTDGTQYNGEIRDNLFDGIGVYTYNDITYEGSFSKNQRTGFGQQLYSDGSEYTGYYLGNVRNYAGSFKFSNGMTYEGGFLNGQFYGVGYLTAETDEELVVLASDEWDGLEFQNNNQLNYLDILPKKGKILFANGDMYEGYFHNGRPVLGRGIWSTLEERLAKQNNKNFTYVAYTFENKTFDFSSVFSEKEVYEKFTSEEYVGYFNDFYKKHKGSIDKIAGGIQTVATLLSIVPSPIQPIAMAVDIGVSCVQIAVKTTSKAIDIYDACIEGNQSLIPGMLGDWGKDIAWDAVNIAFASPLVQKGLNKLGQEVVKGFEKAGATISNIVNRTIAKSPHLKSMTAHLDDILKMGKNLADNVSNVITNSKFYKFVAENGGKLSSWVKNAWIKIWYPTLFSKYGDDATRLLFKNGIAIADQLAKNGDVIVKAAKSQGDDIVRLFLKKGDEIADIVRKTNSSLLFEKHSLFSLLSPTGN